MSFSLSLPVFWRWSKRLKPWLFGGALLFLLTGLWLALFDSPQDYQHGQAVRIMYVHVPASWAALAIYSVMALLSLISFVMRAPLAQVGVRAAAPLGLTFTLMSLVTGSLWGKPMWGAWWVWDARLTSVFVLFLLYLGYMVLIHAHEDPVRGERLGGLLLMAGFINIPLIKFSVEWWQTLHQSASFLRLAGPAIHPSMLRPLLVMAGAYALLFFALWLVRMEAILMGRKLRSLLVLKTSIDQVG